MKTSGKIRVTKENNFFLYWVDSSFMFLFARNKSSETIQEADCKCEEILDNRTMWLVPELLAMRKFLRELKRKVKKFNSFSTLGLEIVFEKVCI